MKVETYTGTGTGVEQILPVRFRDLFALYRLEKRCFPLDSWPLIDIFFAVLLPRLVRLKAVVDQRVVGFVMGDKEKGAGWVATFGVDPDFRQRGIGTRLLQAVERELDMPKYRLCVRKSNVSAIRLYEKNGYLPVDTWARYYKGGEDAVVMEKWRPER